ncbi:uncharacterized protein VTP21DRAFT_4784 [Calcarisporiella thermophila]|uniref:uncharacterized protein n=1 Tax=Calcarisporiella thermophila TaxID=911321 RepID=UPI003742A39D
MTAPAIRPAFIYQRFLQRGLAKHLQRTNQGWEKIITLTKDTAEELNNWKTLLDAHNGSPVTRPSLYLLLQLIPLSFYIRTDHMLMKTSFLRIQIINSLQNCYIAAKNAVTRRDDKHNNGCIGNRLGNGELAPYDPREMDEGGKVSLVEPKGTPSNIVRAEVTSQVVEKQAHTHTNRQYHSGSVHPESGRHEKSSTPQHSNENMGDMYQAQYLSDYGIPPGVTVLQTVNDLDPLLIMNPIQENE